MVFFARPRLWTMSSALLFMVLLCLSGALAPVATAQVTPSFSARHSRYVMRVGSTVYRYTALSAPTYNYSENPHSNTYRATLTIPTITARLDGTTTIFGRVQGSIAVDGVLDSHRLPVLGSATLNLTITGFGGLPNLIKTQVFDPKVNLTAVGGCPLYGTFHENQFGQAWSLDKCTTQNGILIHGVAYSPELGTGHSYYYSNDADFGAVGSGGLRAFNAIQNLINGIGLQGSVSSPSASSSAYLLPQALSANQKKALYLLGAGTIVTALGNGLKNYCAPGQSECAIQYHWLAVLGGVLADIGNSVTIGGTLIFGVVPAIQLVQDQVRNAAIGQRINNYFIAHPAIPWNQVPDLENQIAGNFPALVEAYDN